MMKTAAAIIRAVACLASAAMLLTFPMSTPHSFTDHFRTPEVRRSIVRHTAVAAVEDATDRAIVRIGIEPNALSLPVDFKTKFAAINNVELALQASPTHLFLRLKLRASPAGGEDPLI
jgi:hypothetical protein